MKIFAIVVTYNGMRWYDRCFGSLRDSELPVETIVIDNASKDETVSYIKECFPEICLIESKENLGFAKANNIGMRYALDHDADYVFLLNQDAWVEKDTLTKLMQTFEDNENVGISSPIHLNGDYSGVDFGFVNCIPVNAVSDAVMNKIQKYYCVPVVNAAAWLLSAKCLRTVGGFDTLLFVHYGEDNNYCQRLMYHKLKLVINTSCTICHDREFRSGQDEIVYRNQLYDKNNMFFRLKYANINDDYNFSKLRRQQIKHLFKSILKFSIMRSVSIFRKNMKDFTIIEKSRKLNKIGGCVWL